MTLFAHTFRGLLSCNSLHGDTLPGTRDLVLLRLVMCFRFRCCSCCCSCCSGWFQNKDNFLGPFPSSIVVVVFVVLRSRPRPRSKNQPGPVVLCCTHPHTTAATPSHSYGWLHRGSSSSSKSASTATLCSSRPWSFSFSRPMKIGTIFVSSPLLWSLLLPPGSFPNHL